MPHNHLGDGPPLVFTPGGLTGCPVLLVHGDSTAAWLKRVVAVLDERLPDTRVLELPGDHAGHLQNPDAFHAALERHLAC